MSRLASGLIVTAGLFNLAFAIFHLFFWRLFDWQKELPRLGISNRGIMQVLNLCMTYVFAVTASVLFLFPNEVAGTELGRFLLIAIAGFWLARAIFQPMFFGLQHPLSVVLLGVFILGTILHGLAWWVARGI
ncbi:MAG: hypothetical protein ACT4O5_09605 [Gammaproteobacteria bacterium]